MSYSGTLSSSGLLFLLLIRLSLIQASPCCTEIRICLEMVGKFYLCRLSCIIKEIPGCSLAVPCKDFEIVVSSCTSNNICRLLMSPSSV